MGAFAPSFPLGTLNVALSNYAKEFRNNMMVGDLIAPRVPVDWQTFQYLIFDRSDMRLDKQTLRAPGDSPQTDRMTWSASPYFTQSHALKATLPRELQGRATQAGFDLKQKATARLINKLMLDREVYIANLVTNTANVTNQLALSGTNMWDAYLSSGTYGNPIEEVDAAKGLIRQAGVNPNALLLSDPVLVALKSHPYIVDRFKYTQPGAIDIGQLSQVFGVQCYQASAILLDKGNNASWVWGTNAVLAYVSDATSMSDISALKTFDWTQAPDTVGGYGVLEYPDPDLAAKTDIVSADWYWDVRITAQETLYLFSNCCAAPTMGAIAAPPASF